MCWRLTKWSFEIGQGSQQPTMKSPTALNEERWTLDSRQHWIAPSQ